MIRIDTLDKLFHNGDKFNNGTVITAEWLNSVQEEIAKAIEGLGGTVDGAVANQLAIALINNFNNKSNVDHTHMDKSPADRALAGEFRQVVGPSINGVPDSATQAQIDALREEGWPASSIVWRCTGGN